MFRYIVAVVALTLPILTVAKASSIQSIVNCVEKGNSELIRDLVSLLVEEKRERADLRRQVRALAKKCDNRYITIQKQINDLDNKTELMDKVHTKQIGFTAQIKRDITIFGVVKFGNVLSNYGEAYNANSGKFVCPVNGLYFFIVEIVVSTRSSHIRIYHNDVFIGTVYASNGNHGNGFGSSSFVRKMKKGDNLEVRTTKSVIFQGGVTSFNGFLISV